MVRGLYFPVNLHANYVAHRHISSKDIRDFINQRLSEGMVKSDALHTFQEYLEKVESEEIQPFKGIDKPSD